MDTTLAVEVGILLGALGAAAGKLTEVRLEGMKSEVDAWLPIGKQDLYLSLACSSFACRAVTCGSGRRSLHHLDTHIYISRI